LRFYQRSDCQQCKKEVKKLTPKENETQENTENIKNIENEIIPQTIENFELYASGISNQEEMNYNNLIQ